MRLSKRLIIFLTLTFLTFLPFLTYLLPVFPVQAQQPAPQDMPVEPVKPVMKIEVNDGLLSVEITDAEFGNVIKEIAEKAKFKVELSSDIALKKITVSFKDLDVERGVRRLLTVIREKDFTISYNAAGLIDKLEIYGEGVSKPVVNTQPKKPQIRPKPFQPVAPIPYPLPPPTTLPQ